MERRSILSAKFNQIVMEKIVKQSAGIDCGKKDFAVTFSWSDQLQEIQHLASRKFVNDDGGFKAFNKWIGKLYMRKVPLIMALEATGVYHERLAYFLHDLGYDVSIILPKRAKDFSKTLKVKKVTDKIASQYLAVMGLEKKLDLWVKPERKYADLKSLTREKEQIVGRIVRIKNELEAEKAGVWPNNRTIERLLENLALLQKQKTEVLKEIKQIITKDKELNEKVERILTIPGVGIVTATTVIAETEGFKQVKNKRQLISYAGYDVINQESGTSVRTKARISKRGNKHIRKAMHMPALASIRAEGSNRELFKRLVSTSGIKMRGVVAVQRKLLVLIYTLWKNDTEYNPDYPLKK